jgi:NAD(P)H-dependent FMN reductase
MHNEDIDEQGTDNVNNLRGQVYDAAAVLIGVASTNHLVSTALTNAYNWLVPVLKEKPVALVSI